MFRKSVGQKHNWIKEINSHQKSYESVAVLYRVSHWTVSFGHWLTHIRVQHFVSGSTILECDIWSRVEPTLDSNTSHVKLYKSVVA